MVILSRACYMFMYVCIYLFELMESHAIGSSFVILQELFLPLPGYGVEHQMTLLGGDDDGVDVELWGEVGEPLEW